MPEGSTFTKEGERDLKDLRKQVGDLKHSGLSPFELHDAVTAIAGEVRDVIATGLQHTGDLDHEGDDAKLEDQLTTPNSPSPEQVGASSETSPADTPVA